MVRDNVHAPDSSVDLYLTLIVTLTLTTTGPVRYGQPVSKRAISSLGIAPNGYYIHYTSINSNPYPYPYVRQFMQCLTFRPSFAETASIQDTVVSLNRKVGSVFRVNSKSGSHVHVLN